MFNGQFVLLLSKNTHSRGYTGRFSLLLVVDMNFSRGIFVIGASLEK
jgi:hypothetical protein